MGEKLFDSDNEPKKRIDPSELPRVDWLTGPGEGTGQAPPRAPLPDAPKLTRPGYPAGGPDPAPPEAPRYPPEARIRLPGTPGGPTQMPAWAPPPRSVPTMRRRAGDVAGGPPASAGTRDFPMDDADERARMSALAAEEQAREAAVAARPHAVVRPQEFDMPALPLPWWARIPQLLAGDRRVQSALFAAVVAVLGITLWPHPNHAVAIARLKSNPERFTDLQVRVEGRVSEVFAVGGSWAYTLVQGRDTIVVFSRTRQPRPRELVTVIGTLSPGRLDGQSRVALLEATSQ